MVTLEPDNLNTLSADKPLSDPKDDRLGYAEFARHLAESICKMATTEGLVVTIYGPWGSGKTTLLHFVVHYVRQKPENEQPIIVYFNPWWFSGREDLIRRFFDQLLATLSEGRLVAKDLTKQIADFAEVVSEAPSAHIAFLGKFIKHFVRRRDVPQLKAKIKSALEKQKKRILVVIDDVDRLTADEIRQLFCVIKAIADFPNVVYLLAFDKEVVIKALSEAQGIPGEVYLEKIVQVPFEIPLPDKTSLRELLFERLNAILAGTLNEAFDQTYWGNVYFDGIDHFITKPRDIVRLTNTLSITYNVVKGEVNPIDFIAIETLRVFCPLVYDIIRKNPKSFAGHNDTRDSQLGSLKTFHDSWLTQIQEEYREPVKRLLLRIFPKLGAVWGNIRYGADYESSWRRQLRVCSPYIFPIYFRLAIPEGGISNAEMKATLALASDAKAFAAKLIELANQKRPDGTTRVRAFLERLEDYTEKEVSSECIPPIVKALFDVGDQLWRPEDEQISFGNDLRIWRIIRQLLCRLDEPARFKVLKEVMSEGQAVSTIVRIVAVLGMQHGKYGAKEPDPEDQRLISAQHLTELEKLALEKVRNAAERNYLLQAPHLWRILYRWQDWAGVEEVKQWVQKAISNDEGLVNILEGFLQKGSTRSLSDVIGRVIYRLDPQWLEPFLEPSQIIDRIRRLAENSRLTEIQKIAVRQFIREYEIRQQGKNPNEPWTWEAE